MIQCHTQYIGIRDIVVVSTATTDCQIELSTVLQYFQQYYQVSTEPLRTWGGNDG